MASNSIMLLIDPSNGKILDANPTACDFYGYDRNKFKNTLYVHDLNTLSSKEIEVEMQDAVKNNRKYFNFNHRLASGEIRSIEVYTTKLIENEKTILFSIIHDITDRKILEEELRKSKEQYELIAENTSDSIVIVSFDENLTYLYANPTDDNELSLKPEQLLGKSLFEFIHPDDANDVLLILNKYLKIKNDNPTDTRLQNINETLEFRAISPDGSWRHMQTTVNTIGNDLLAVSKNVTNLKKFEESLRKSKEHAENLLNISAGIIISLDTTGKITLLNDSGYKLLGFKKGTLLGKNWFDNCVPKDMKTEIKTVFASLMNGNLKNVRYYENSILTKNGDEKIISWHNTLLYDCDNSIVGLISSGQDITQQVNTNIKLHNSHERYQNFLNISVAGIWRIELKKPCSVQLPEKQQISAIMDNRIAECNDALVRMYGYKNKKDLIGLSLSEFITKENAREVIKTIIQNGYSFSGVESEEYNKDGEVLYFRNSVYATIENGILYRFWGTQEDITKQKLSQIALKESEEKFAHLFNTSPNAITISNIEDGKIIEINDSGLKDLGYKKSEVIGKSAIELGLITKEQRTILIEALMKKGHYSKIEIPVTLNSGKLVVGLFYGRIISLAGNEYLFQTIVDISEIKKLENELTASRKKYQDLFDNAPDMHFSVDVNGTILSVNKGGANYLGYTKNELIGKPVWNVVYKKDLKTVKQQIANIIKIGKKYSDIEFRKIKKDGTIIFVQERIQCINNIKDKPCELRIVCRDITEIEKTRQRISDYQDSLKSMTYELGSIEDTTKRQIADRLHDDIGQAMALSKITLSNISENMSYSEISKKVDSAKSYLNNAIKFSRDLTYEISPPILHELGLGAAIKWYTNQINKIFDIKFQVIENKINISMSDNIRILLYKSIVELINNIVKHSNATIVSISIYHFKSFLRITVKDNGIGFKNKTWENSSKNKKFGLFSINERIKYIGGTFKIESVLSKGSKITIKVPI